MELEIVNKFLDSHLTKRRLPFPVENETDIDLESVNKGTSRHYNEITVIFMCYVACLLLRYIMQFCAHHFT